MEFVQHLPANKLGKDYIVGDLHGCYTALINALEVLKFDQSVDRLFSVGDLIDRGTENIECLKLLEQPWFFAVRGNHEGLMLYATRWWEFKRMWDHNGGEWAEHYSDVVLDAWRKKLDTLPGIIVVGNEGKDRFNVLHAEPEYPYTCTRVTDKMVDATPGTEKENPERALYWGRFIIRNPNNAPTMRQLSRTYVGHTVVRQLVRVGPIFYIDRGAVFEKAEKNNDFCLAIACHTDDVIYEFSSVTGNVKATKMRKVPQVSKLLDAKGKK